MRGVKDILLVGSRNPMIAAIYRHLMTCRKGADMVATSSSAVTRLALNQYQLIVLAEYLPEGRALDLLRVLPRKAGRILIVCERAPMPEPVREAKELGGRMIGPDWDVCVQVLTG